MIKNIVAGCVAFIFFCTCWCTFVFADDKPCEIVKPAIEAASSIRLLAIKKAVPCFVQDRESVRSHIMALVDEKTPPAKMHLEGLTYKALGLIPDSFNYEKGLIDLYVSQLGGYYDPEHKFSL